MSARVLPAPEAAARSGEIEVERVDSADRLEQLRPEWDRIQDLCPWKHVLLDFRWVSAWWRSFGAGKELHVLALRQDGRFRAPGRRDGSGARDRNAGEEFSPVDFVRNPLRHDALPSTDLRSFLTLAATPPVRFARPFQNGRQRRRVLRVEFFVFPVKSPVSLAVPVPGRHPCRAVTRAGPSVPT